MAFISFSNQLAGEGVTAVSNVFLREYLPHSNGDCVRVYLYGLWLGARGGDNTIAGVAGALNLPEGDVTSAYQYWHELGLVQLVDVKPLEVKYLPVKSGGLRAKKVPKGKYDEFTAQIQALIGNSPDFANNREVTKTELEEYHYLLDSMDLEPAALLMIAKYCTDLKGTNVGYKYIINVAKNWAYAGIKTARDVESRLQGERISADTISAVLAALGLKRNREPDDFALFDKWTKQLGFKKDVLLFVATAVKGSMAKLDAALLGYHEKKLLDVKKIEKHKAERKDLLMLARAVVKKLGLVYQDVEPVVETYVAPWLKLGLDSEAIKTIAKHCFEKGIRTLAGMNLQVQEFANLKAVTKQAVDSYVSVKGVLPWLQQDTKSGGKTNPKVTRHSFSAGKIERKFDSPDDIKF